MMRKIVWVLTICLAYAAPAAGQADSETTSREIGQEVIAVIAKWGEAVRSRNSKVLNEIFEDNAIITSFDGSTRTKAAELELLKPDPGNRTLSVKNEDIKVRVFGSAAVATAECRMAYVRNEKLMNTIFRYTAAFVRDKGSWRIVALHTSRPST